MDSFIDRLMYTLSVERTKYIRSGVYGFTQREMAYNSNKIEGSRLSKEQTASLFDTQTIYGLDEYRAKDIEEATGHFVMFNNMLDTLNMSLSENMIKQFHLSLKQGVFEDIANGYNIGQYKSRVNYAGTVETCHPDNVSVEMNKLINEYTGKQNKTLLDIAKFHVIYETIHPFQDGNGRTGRIIMFRESIVNNIVPFIIRDINKAQYINCMNLARYNNDYSSLLQYFSKEQQWYYDKVHEMLI